MTRESPQLRLVQAQTNEVTQIASFEWRTAREFVGINGAARSAELASPAQLDALIAGLKPGESVVALVELAGAKSSGLSIEIAARGNTEREAAARSDCLGALLDAALGAALPIVETRKRSRKRRQARLPHRCTLVPAGLTLPLGEAPPPTRSRSGPAGSKPVHDFSEAQRDVIVFSPSANGPHLASLSAVVAAIKTPLHIEVCMTQKTLDGALLERIAATRARIAQRMLSDAHKLLRDPRYTEADQRLENVIVDGSGIQLDVCVCSKRALVESEISALSAAVFGKPQAEDQRGHLASLRALYPRDEGLLSFLAIVAAGVLPAIERRQVQQLRSLDGSVVGKLAGGQAIRMPVDQPRSHTYIIGRPGCGKSTLLLRLILQDIEAGRAVVLVDPHGDLWSDVRERLPARRAKDVQLVHMGDPELQPRLNLLELGPGEPAEARARVVDTLGQLVRRMMYSGLTVDAMGPMFNKYFRAGLMLLLEGEGAEARIQAFERVFTDGAYRRDLLERPSVSPETKLQWQQIVAVGGDHHSLEGMTPWVTSKLTQITQSAILRPILGATTTSLDFDRILSENRVCLINLANGRIGPEPAMLLGGILTHRLEQAAKRQESVKIENRHSASVYLDEFHTFASEFLRPLMAETRKFGLRVTLANQTLSQMISNDIDGGVLREVLGNCANSVVFAVDVDDARYLAPRFGGKIDAVCLTAQANYHAVCQFQTLSGMVGPFRVRTLAPPAVQRCRK